MKTIRELTAQAKRLTAVLTGLNEAADGIEVAVGQLDYLEGKGSTHVNLTTKECAESLNRDLEFLRSECHSRMEQLVLELSRTTDTEAYDLEKPSVLDEADNLLKGGR